MLNNSYTSIDGLSDGEQDEMNDLLCSVAKSPTKSSPVKDSKLLAKDILTREYNNEIPIPVLPPVDTTLADIITKWCRIPPKRDEVKELFKEALLPENVSGLKPVKVNEMLYRKMSSNAKINDQKWRGINTFIARGCGSVISVLDQLCCLEAEIHNSGDIQVQIKDKKLVINDHSFDFAKLRELLGKGTKLLCSAHSIVLQRRKTLLKSSLDPKFHFLLREQNPVTTELLGEDIEQKISESSKDQ